MVERLILVVLVEAVERAQQEAQTEVQMTPMA